MPAIVRTNAAPVRISWAAKLSKREWRVERFETEALALGKRGDLLKRDYLFNPSSQKKQLATKKHRKHKGKKTLRRKRLSSIGDDRLNSTRSRFVPLCLFVAINCRFFGSILHSSFGGSGSRKLRARPNTKRWCP